MHRGTGGHHSRLTQLPFTICQVATRRCTIFGAMIRLASAAIKPAKRLVARSFESARFGRLSCARLRATRCSSACSTPNWQRRARLTGCATIVETYLALVSQSISSAPTLDRDVGVHPIAISYLVRFLFLFQILKFGVRKHSGFPNKNTVRQFCEGSSRNFAYLSDDYSEKKPS